MAKWAVKPGFINNTMTGKIEYESGARTGESRWEIYQDEKPFLEQAKQDREASTKKTNNGYKKFATIPDIVAIEIKEKHGIDIHAQDTMHDKHKMAKFMTLIRQDYAYLLSY